MNLKQAIDSQFKKNTDYTNPEQAVNQAESLNTLSADIYTDSKRFIFELLQNADDSADSDKNLSIAIKLFGNQLVIAHNGRPFSERDLIGLCSINHGTKKKDAQKTGYKGIGFKAVFGKSDRVIIYSEQEFFRFDKNNRIPWNAGWDGSQSEWEKEHERQFFYPWQIIPIWTEPTTIDRKILHFISPTYRVATILHLDDLNPIINAINDIQKEPKTFLFLRNISKVSFDVGPSILIEKKVNELGIIDIVINSRVDSSWLVRKFELPIPQNIKDDLKRDKNTPEKLKSLDVTEISLAVSYNNGLTDLAGTPAVLFSYLPTSNNKYRFPTLVNANFLMNANREQLPIESSWNQWLFAQIPSCLLNWIKDLLEKQETWGTQPYAILPQKLEHADALANKYNEGLILAKESIPCILSSSGHLLKINEGIIDSTGLSQTTFVGEQLIRELVINAITDSTAIHAKPFIPNNTGYTEVFKKVGVAVFEPHDILKLLSNVNFIKKHGASKNILLLSFLNNKTKNESGFKELNLTKCAFILSHKNNLSFPESIYFPPIDDPTGTDPDNELDYVHPDVITWLQSNPSYFIWLEELGVQEKTDISYIEKTIIPNIDTWITPSNSVESIRWLFGLFLKNEIGSEIISRLSKIKLLTTKGSLIPACDCYLSAVYKPRVNFEEILEEDFFVSPDYITNQDPLKDWQRFFDLLGVASGIKSLIIEGRTRIDEDLVKNHFDEAYFKDKQMSFKPAYNWFWVEEISGIATLRLIEFCSNYEFARLFWADVIQNQDINRLTQAAIAFWGHRSMEGWTGGSKVFNYLPFSVLNGNIIPESTGHCLRSTDIFLNTKEHKELAVNYLPVFEYEGELSEDWRAFFRFKVELTPSDYIVLLKSISTDVKELGKVKEGNEKRIQLVYQKLSKQLDYWDANQRELFSQVAQDLHLLSENGTFKSAKSLKYFDDGKNSLFKDDFDFIETNKDTRAEESFEQLLNLFGVQKLSLDYFELKELNGKVCDALRQKLNFVLPYLAQWISVNDKIPFEEISYDLERRFSSISFSEADRLTLYFEDAPLKNVSLYEKSGKISVLRPWNGEIVMIELPRKLRELLKVRKHDFLISFLLRGKKEEIDSYFQNQGVAIPEARIEPATSNTTNGIRKPTMGMSIDHEKIKEEVVKENVILLHDAPEDSAQMLLYGIAQQDSPYKGFIYHFTHIENAASILREQKLKGRGTSGFKDSAGTGAIEHTSNEKKAFARFYFRPKTPTQYYNENLGKGNMSIERFGNEPICPVPVFFKIPLNDVISNTDINWEISLGNMARGNVLYGNSIELIREFDFNGLFLSEITPRGFASSQQEFLVKDALSLPISTKIICQDNFAKSTLFKLIGISTPSLYDIEIDSSLFFNDNPRIDIHEENGQITIQTDPSRRGELFLQIETQNPISYQVNGDISTAFEFENSRIFCAKEQMQVTNAPSSYAVHFLYKGKLWLIHSTYEGYRFPDKYWNESLRTFLLGNITVEGLFQIVESHPIIKHWYAEPLGGPDALNLAQHTDLVIKNYLKYFQHQQFALTHAEWLIMLALHDIGKPQAVAEENKERQHLHTIRIFEELHDVLPLDEARISLLKSLINGDPIGKYLNPSHNVGLEETVDKIHEKSTETGMNITELWFILVAYYQCDAGGYPSLQKRLFEYSSDKELTLSTDKRRLKFSPEYEKKFLDLENKVLAN